MITMKKKVSSYIGIGGLMVFIGAAVFVMGAAGGGMMVTLVGLAAFLMALNLIYTSAVFCVTVDEDGITQRKSRKREERRTWEELELWLTFTPKGDLNSVILRANGKNWCELQNLKMIANYDEGLKLIRKNLKVSKMFNHKGEIPLPEEEW